MQEDIVEEDLQTNTNTQTDQNYDEALLISARVDETLEYPVLNQVLRIAVYDEYRAYESYKKILEKFGDVQPFTNIIQAEVNHYQTLIPLLEKYNIEIPINDWEAKVEEPNSILEACEIGVAAEIENIKMYDNLISYAKDYPDVLDVMYKLQAASYNNHLPAFREHVVKHTTGTTSSTNTSGQNPMDNMNEIMGKMDEFSALASKAASGQIGQDDLMKILGSNNISLIGGAVLGALGAGVVSQMIKDKEETKKEEDEEDAK